MPEINVDIESAVLSVNAVGNDSAGIGGFSWTFDLVDDISPPIRSGNLLL